MLKLSLEFFAIILFLFGQKNGGFYRSTSLLSKYCKQNVTKLNRKQIQTFTSNCRHVLVFHSGCYRKVERWLMWKVNYESTQWNGWLKAWSCDF